jgi:uncharacterized protein YdaU (DUF1376 family)
MSSLPYMPLWVPDFLSDTEELDARETGALILLLMSMWKSGGQLPNDPKKLRRIARVERDWTKVWAAISHHFSGVGESHISNARLSTELEKVRAMSTANKRNGARGGRAKALKTREEGLANGKDSPDHSLYHPEPEPKPKDIPDGISPPLSSPTAQSASSEKRSEATDPAKTRAHAVQIPNDWAPDQIMTQDLMVELHLTPEDMRYCFNQMKDHANAKGRELVDWNAGYRKWVHKAVHDGELNRNGRRSATKGASLDAIRFA